MTVMLECVPGEDTIVTLCVVRNVKKESQNWNINYEFIFWCPPWRRSRFQGKTKLSHGVQFHMAYRNCPAVVTWYYG